MTKDYRDIDPDDFFAETKMSFGDHLEDLRVHLLRAVYGFLLCMVIGFVVGKSVLAFIAKPVTKELEAFYERRSKDTRAKQEEGGDIETEKADEATEFVKVSIPKSQAEALHKGDWKALAEVEKPSRYADDEDLVHLWWRLDNPVRFALATEKAQMLVGRRFGLSTLSVQEAFMVYFKVSLVTGFVLGAPWIFYQIWSFVAVGLYPHEKKLINVYLPFSIGLFIFGVIICEFFVIPKSIEALLWFNEWIGLEPDLRLSEWLGFAIMMPVVFGISFQTPLVMLFLYRIGVMTVQSYREKRKLIWFLLAVFAAVITPSTDPYSMMFLWIPLCLLFEVGIWLCTLYPQPEPLFGEQGEESEEVIEV